PAATAATRGAGDLRGRVAAARADLVDLEFDRRAVVALAVLVAALLEAALRDDAHALRERAGHVLGELAPARRAQEQRLAVLPLVRLTVERAGRGRDREVGDGQAVLRVAQLGVRGEVAHHRDDRLAGHDQASAGAAVVAGDLAAASALRAARFSSSAVCAASRATASSARSTLVRSTASDSFSCRSSSWVAAAFAVKLTTA